MSNLLKFGRHLQQKHKRNFHSCHGNQIRNKEITLNKESSFVSKFEIRFLRNENVLAEWRILT